MMLLINWIMEALKGRKVVNNSTIRLERCTGCGQDLKFFRGSRIVAQAFNFEEALNAYDRLAPTLEPEERGRLRTAVLGTDFLAGYDSQARSPLYATPGELRRYRE